MSEPARGPAGGLTPYISVDGADAASAFYQKAFGATELVRQPAEDGKRLLHCHLEINGGSLMMSDYFPEWGMEAKPSQGFTLHLQVQDVDAWWKRATEAGCVVTMPLELQFWGDRYGKIADPFGIGWSLAETPASGGDPLPRT